MSKHWIYLAVLPLLLGLVFWVGYQIGYHAAGLDLLRFATATPIVTTPSTQPHSAPQDTTTQANSKHTKASAHDVPTTAPIDALSNLVPEAMMLTLIDVIPAMQLAALMHQTTHIPVDKLLAVAQPRTLAKQLLVASNLLDATDVLFINDSTLGYSNVQISAHVNAARQPAQTDKPLVAGRQRLYISFEAVAEQHDEPHYLIKVVKQGAPDVVVYFKFFAFTNTGRQYVWVERNWLAGDYQVELFVLGAELERVQAVYFTILPPEVS